MKTIVISMIGIGSILFVVMIQHTASKRMWSYERAETSLSSAMEQTMSEVFLAEMLLWHRHGMSIPLRTIHLPVR